jgi:hypothetical protein
MPADVVRPAWHLLQHELNDRLAEHSAMPALVWDGDPRELKVRLKPTSLISALWLQLVAAIGQEHSYRTCAACRTWFQVGPGGDMRADAKYCSNACRQRKYREEHEKRLRKPARAQRQLPQTVRSQPRTHSELDISALRQDEYAGRAPFHGRCVLPSRNHDAPINRKQPCGSQRTE